MLGLLVDQDSWLSFLGPLTSDAWNTEKYYKDLSEINRAGYKEVLKSKEERKTEAKYLSISDE